MRHMTFRERQYRRTRLNCVRHITLDPKGPGVVRIHMIPPRDEMPDAPFLLLLNGARLDPALFLELCRTLAGERAGELLDCLM